MNASKPATKPRSQASAKPRRAKAAPRIGLVSLGCPKALVDSERILTRLRAEGYIISSDYQAADLVLVNTCGFLDSARSESLEAIGEAIAENGRVLVTGCLGVEAELIRQAHPDVLAITGPHQYEAVMEAVHAHAPPLHDPFLDLVPPEGVRLTPRHFAYLKISEGCNNRCSFCIIPQLRGDLQSRPIHAVLKEAQALVDAGVKEILVISQDTSAYGLDLDYAAKPWRGREVPTRFYELVRELGEFGAWTRLHYVYPYPHVDAILPLMAEGRILPYLDIPFQHASPKILKAMRRPAKQDKILQRIADWRRQVPDLAIRSTFIVGFPGETDADFEILLDFLHEAKIDRAGVFKYENVEGAPSRDLADPVDAELIDERYDRFMEAQTQIMEDRAHAQIGREIAVIVDGWDEEGQCYQCRSTADAPEVDASVFVETAAHWVAGDIVRVRVTGHQSLDLLASAPG